MIQTKVAKIISPTSAVLAAGIEQGVQEGMEFVLYELSDEVLDPETNESLGKLELHKGRVKIYSVQPRISLASTFRKVRFDLFGRGVAAGLLASMQEERLEELSIDRTQLSEVKPNLLVRVGDLARTTSSIPAALLESH